jgi:hypothetical protein
MLIVEHVLFLFYSRGNISPQSICIFIKSLQGIFYAYQRTCSILLLMVGSILCVFIKLWRGILYTYFTNKLWEQKGLELVYL